MNVICSIFLTFFMVFKPLIPLVDYAVNYKYINQVLCVNKSKPMLHCNGKCYLAKELSQSNDTQSPLNKGKNTIQKIIDIYIPAAIAKIVISENPSFQKSDFTFEMAYSFQFLKNIFRPPVF